MIDFEYLTQTLKKELVSIVNESEVLKQYDIFIDLEREFLGEKQLKENAIYVVISYDGANNNFAEYVVPFTLNVLSENNDLDIAKELLNTFALRFNLASIVIEVDGVKQKLLQLFDTPLVNDAFSEVDSGYRALMSLEGSFVIASNTNDLTSVEFLDSETQTYINIPFITGVIEFTNTVLPEPQGDTYGRNKTINLNQTITISIATYLLNNSLFDSVLDNYLSCQGDFNARYTLKITFLNGKQIVNDFVVSSFKITKELGRVSNVNIAFAY